MNLLRIIIGTTEGSWESKRAEREKKNFGLKNNWRVKLEGKKLFLFAWRRFTDNNVKN